MESLVIALKRYLIALYVYNNIKYECYYSTPIIIPRKVKLVLHNCPFIINFVFVVVCVLHIMMMYAYKHIIIVINIVIYKKGNVHHFSSKWVNLNITAYGNKIRCFHYLKTQYVGRNTNQNDMKFALFQQNMYDNCQLNI